MTFEQFHNGLRVLLCLSGKEILDCINSEDREYFGDDYFLTNYRANLFTTFCELPTQDAERLFAVIQTKNEKANI